MTFWQKIALRIMKWNSCSAAGDDDNEQVRIKHAACTSVVFSAKNKPLRLQIVKVVLVMYYAGKTVTLADSSVYVCHAG
jgi:hypothetical protein